jgi:hypothetical protein
MARAASEKNVWAQAYRDSHKVEIAARNKAYHESHQSEIKLQRATYYQINRERIRNEQTAARYSITVDDYLALVINGCWVCGTMEGLHIDHDHKCCDTNSGWKSCGKCVRGVLCHDHNNLLRCAHDNVGELMKAAAYLMQFEEL